MDAPREYYDAIDGGDYSRLTDLLAPSFVHVRPDRTIEGRDQFVQFMAEERPLTDTEHDIRAIITDGQQTVVEGTLYRSDGSVLFRFADVHELESDQLARIRTYTA